MIENLALIFTLVFLCAGVSACLGMAGGSILLASLSLVFTPISALVLHMVAQLTGSLYRVVFFRKHINLDVVKNFVIGLILSSLLGYFLFSKMKWDSLQIIMGAFLVLNAFSGFKGKFKVRNIHLISMGFFAGLVGAFVGAVGSLISILLLRLGLTGSAFIGTKSLIQTSTHSLRGIIYIFNENIAEVLNLKVILIIITASFLGTYIGKKYLKIEEPKFFRNLARVFIALSGLLLIWGGL